MPRTPPPAAAAAFEKSGDEAAAEKALAKARQALRAAITVAAGDDDDDGATTDGESSADGGGTPAPPVSEFGQTWMMLDGWVTRATFHYLSGGRDGAMIRTAGTTGGEDGTSTTDADGDEDPVLGPDLPPRSPFEAAASKAAGAELSRALPVACRMLKLRSSSTALERPLGRLLRTFFFQGAVPALKPARWTLVCAVLLEAIGTRRLAEGERDDRPPSLAEDFAREVRSIHWSPYDPRRRGERRSLRTFPGVSLLLPLAFNHRPRRLSTPTDAFELHLDIALYGTTLRRSRAAAVWTRYWSRRGRARTRGRLCCSS